MISVIIATYNRGQYIKKAIKSVLNQTYKDIEIIVIDDGSTDNTREVLDFYIKTKGVRYIYQENAGSMNARDNGIKHSRGKYIAILDSDDIWCDKTKLEKQARFLEKFPSYVLVGGSIVKVNEKDEVIAEYIHPEHDWEIRKVMLLDNMFSHSTVVFRKYAWKFVGGYCSEFANDWNMWLKLGKVGRLHNYQEYFTYYLEWNQNTSRHNIRQNLKIDIKMRKKYRNDYPNFRKAIIWAWISYFYSYFPFKEQIYALRRKNI